MQEIIMRRKPNEPAMVWARRQARYKIALKHREEIMAGYTCPSCGERFEKERGLKMHTNIHCRGKHGDTGQHTG